MNSFFVTGTDTDVGKTCVSAAIVKHLRDIDVDVGVMKPFASGYKATPDSISHDVEILMKYSGVTDPTDLINPYYFEIPTSPYDASKQLNLEIDISKVIESYKQLASIHDVVIVEGIGGIMTPISKNYFVSDLISDLKLSSLIVIGSKIGTVNHFMLTYEHARQKNLNLKGFLVNQNVSDGYELTNLKHQIFGLTGHRVFGAIPHNPSFTIESYVENFPNFVDISKIGLENI
ncbi:MAG: dethiobiotin synthase [Crenarchaeota archaeon]|nr:dethiobiotin synthase [Thermoproteota archaeon]MDA1124361.1 dethiobiotin synthase [Thermoproteota archaeon]